MKQVAMSKNKTESIKGHEGKSLITPLKTNNY